MFLTKCKIPVKASTYIYVPTDYGTIQEAINAASPGDTIYVYKNTSGPYLENVVVNKSVTLIGEDVDLTVIDGKGAQGTGTVIYINASYVNIHGFTIRNSGTNPYNSGIYVDHSTGSNISGNKILNTNDGISLYYSSSILISNNVMSFNYYSGVVFYSSSNNVIACNILSSNYYGVYLYSSDDNTISDNMIFSNFYGIQLYSSCKNMISGNNVSASLDVGMHITFYSVNNTFYHNNINNTKNAQSDVMNVWDYEGEGNYWNDYEGQDLDEDGIGDTPYTMNSIQDNHPLMGAFSDFKIVLEKEIYSVTTISNSTISDFEFQIGKETGNKIISFNTTNANGVVGFCRIKIPTKLMEYPNIILVDNEEIAPTKLDASNKTYACLYFTYLHNCVVTIISSESLRQYYELLDKYLGLQESFSELNDTYHRLLTNFTTLQFDLYTLNKAYYALLTNFTTLQFDLYTLNEMYHSLSNNYTFLLGDYNQLQKNLGELNVSYQALYNLNQTYYALINNYTTLLGDYNQLKGSFDMLNNSYQEHLLDYFEQIEHTRNLLYIFIATTAIFIIATVYLSKRAHASSTIKTKVIEER
jgi:parallel beta-helix repeat protein